MGACQRHVDNLDGRFIDPADPDVCVVDEAIPLKICSGTAAVKCRPARDSLIKRINSLMARFNSLLGRNKFPVPIRRELGRKPLNLALYSEPIAALGGPDEQNSLYFPS
jgi:hypothetical protein